MDDGMGRGLNVRSTDPTTTDAQKKLIVQKPASFTGFRSVRARRRSGRRLRPNAILIGERKEARNHPPQKCRTGADAGQTYRQRHHRIGVGIAISNRHG